MSNNNNINSSQVNKISSTKSNPFISLPKAKHSSTRINHMRQLDIYNEPHFYRKSGIICTIGPKTNSVEKLEQLMKVGMNVVRMNFSHGDHKYHQSVIDNARQAAKNLGKVVAIALDTKGPEIRTGLLADDDIYLEVGHEFLLTTNEERKENGNLEAVFVDYKNLPKVMDVGGLIYVDDGLISLEVLEKGDDFVKVKVINSGMLGSRKGVNLPDVDVDLPAVSEKDKKDLLFGVKNNVDMVFASFIRKSDDVEEVRNVLGEEGKNIKIISKIENHEGVRNFDEILLTTDGVMVARGDLGIEIAAQKVFLAQKMMISKCNVVGKPVICATQMLESMTQNPRPTRAEVSDVANAILDGSDCVMLSGETAKGNYPLEAVSMMDKICKEAEAAMFYGRLFNELREETPNPVSMTETIASSAVNASFEHHAAAIIVLTTSGNSARLVAKYRPACPIFTVTRSGNTARNCHLYRGCFPIHYTEERDNDWQQDVQNRYKSAMKFGKEMELLLPGQTVIAIQGSASGCGHTNSLRILFVE
eukprot:TRINITY_DN8998_c0_g1_i1.p1 TRINITY_DN8998_c0_g1~~TRINITY_DN8998_c0_g1_i1.p1  ORF type:complete len:532 (-),score=210.45 TRINITY_DN8998_c0_g1_i1:223-1818(-)